MAFPLFRRSMLIMQGTLVAALVLNGCASDDVGPIPVVVDYSPTVSDVGALTYLLAHPEVDVRAVTLPATGEAGCELGAEVTLGILAMFDRIDVPVACDPERPPAAEEWPEAFLSGADALALTLPDPISSLDPRPAHQLIADTGAASDSPVVLYAAAPLANVARAVETHRDHGRSRRGAGQRRGDRRRMESLD